MSCRDPANPGTASNGCSTSSDGWTNGCREPRHMRLILTSLLGLAALVACSEPAAHQTAAPKSAEKPTSTLPDGWKARLDDPVAQNTGTVQVEKDAVIFTGGPGGIYYKPDMRAEKDYTISASFTLQKPLPAPQPYGLFVSGAELEKDAVRYTAFLVRQDGKY